MIRYENVPTQLMEGAQTLIDGGTETDGEHRVVPHLENSWGVGAAQICATEQMIKPAAHNFRA